MDKKNIKNYMNIYNKIIDKETLSKIDYTDAVKVYNCTIMKDEEDTLICRQDFMDLFDINEYIKFKNDFYYISIENHLFNSLDVSSYYSLKNKINHTLNGSEVNSKFSITINKRTDESTCYYNWHLYKQEDGSIRVILIDITTTYSHITQADTLSFMINQAAISGDVGCWVTFYDAEPPICWATDSTVKLMNITPNESMIYDYSKWQNIIKKSIGEEKYKEFQHSIENNDEPVAIKYMITDDNDNEQWFLMKASNYIRNKSGKIKRLYGTITNITEQLQCENEFGNLAYLFNETSKSGNIGAWVLDFEKHPGYFWGTDTIAKMVNITPNENMLYSVDLVKDILLDNMGEELFNDLIRIINDAISGNTENYDMKHYLYNSMGEMRWYRSKSYNIERDSTGKAVRMYGVLIDIDEQIKNEIELKELTEILDTTMKSGNVGAWVLDYSRLEDSRLWASEVTAFMCGFEPNSTMLFNPQDIIKNFNSTMKKNSLIESSNQKPINEFEYNHLYKLTNTEGEMKWYSSVSQNITKDKNGNIKKVYGVLIDVDEQINRQKQLEVTTSIRKTLQNLSTHYINVDLSTLDYNMNQALFEISSAVGVDRAYIYDYCSENNICIKKYEWCNPNTKPISDIYKKVSMIPFVKGISKIKNTPGSYIFNNVECVKDNNYRHLLNSSGIKSVALFPVFFDSKLYGFIGYDAINSFHNFSEEEILLLESFAGIYSNIVSRIKSEEMLLQGRKRLKLSTQAAKIAYWEWDLLKNTAISDVQYYNIMGVECDDSNPNFWNKYIHPDDIDCFFQAVDRHLSGQAELYETTFRFYNPVKSEYIWVKETGKIVSWTSDGEPSVIAGISQDITNIKITEEVARKTTKKLQLATESANIVTWEYNIATDTGYLSERLIDEYGGETVQNNFLNFLNKRIHPEDYSVYIKSYNDYISGNSDTINSEYRIIANDGNYKWVLSSGKAAEFDNDGNPLVITGILMNLDEKKRYELELINKERNWSNLYNSTKKGMIILDMDSNIIINVNPALVSILGANNSNDFIGKPFDIFSPKYHSDKADNIDYIKSQKDTFEKDGFIELEITYKKSDDETIILETESVKTIYSGKFVSLITITDITESKHQRELVEQSERKLKITTQIANIAYWEYNCIDDTSNIGNMYENIMGFNPMIKGVDTWETNIHPDDKDYVLKENHDHRKGLAPLYSATYRFYNSAKKEYIWVKDTGMVDTYDDDGNPHIMIGISQDITATKLIEEEIKRTAQKLRMATESTNTITWEWDIESDTINALQKDDFFTEITPSISNARECTIEHIHPDDVQDFLSALNIHFDNTSSILRCELRYRYSHSKEYIWVYIAGRINKTDIDGNPLSMTGIMMDIDEKKQNELMIQIREKDLFNIYNTASNGILILEADTLNIVDINPAGMSIFDTADKSLFIGKESLVLSPKLQHDGRDSSHVLEEAITAADKEGSYTYEFTYLTVNGLEVICEIQLVISEYQNKPAYISSFIDITTRKLDDMRMKSLLKIADYEIKSIDEFTFFTMREALGLFQCNIMFVFYYDKETDSLLLDSIGRVDLYEPFFSHGCKTCPLTKEKIILKAVDTRTPIYDNNYNSKIKCIKDMPLGNMIIQNILTIPILYQGELIGMYAIANSKRPFTEDTANQLKMFSDSVYKKIMLFKNTQQIIEAKESAEKAATVKTKFLANMSHEIRTPINAVIGLNELLKSTNLTYQQNDYVEKITNSAKNLLGIINDILDFSKMESEKLIIEHTSLNLNTVLDDVYTLFSNKAIEKNLELIINKDMNVPVYLLGDPLRLAQILINLTSNAIKFTDGGEVIISVELVKSDDDQAILKFIITDNGIGMKQEQADNLFQAFEQADSSTTRKYGGTGLGLSITKNIVDLMNGTISVSTEYAKGSEFSVTLTFDIDKDTKIRESKKNNEAEIMNSLEAIKGARVLIVDDNELNQQIVTELLESVDFVVDAASDGIESIEKLEKNKYDLIFMDLQMPNMDGYTTSEYIRNDMKLETPIVALSADVMSGVSDRVRLVGMNSYISKPIDKNKLYKSLIQFIAPNNGCIKSNAELINKEYTKNDSYVLVQMKKVLLNIDVDYGYRISSEDLELYKKKLSKFAGKYSNFMANLNYQLNTNKIESAIKGLYKLSRISEKLGAISLFEMVTLLESKLKNEDISEFDSVMENLENELDMVIEQIDSFFRLSGSIQNEPLKDISDEDMITVLEQVCLLLDTGNTQANDICNELFDYKHNKNISKMMQSLREHISNFDFDIGLDLCKKIIKELKNNKD